MDDLASSKAVIANAGLTLITEAFYFKKPYLALPIKKRFEQLTNSYHLKKLGYGNYTERLDWKKLNSFLKNIPVYSKNLKKYKKSNNSKLYKLLDKLIKKFGKK